MQVKEEGNHVAVADIGEIPALIAPGGRLAGLDLGTKTIGVAVSDAGLSFAHPRPMIARRKFTQDAQALLVLLQKEAVSAVIIGLPVNMDGSEGPRVQATRAFVRNMEKLTDLPFVFMFLILIIIIAPPVAPVLLVILPLFIFVAWKSGNVMAAANQEERQSSISRDQLIAEMIQGRTTIKALALDQAMRPHWEQSHADNIEKSAVRGAKTDFYSNLGGSLSMSTTLLMTTVGALAIVNQEMTMGSLIAANMLSGRLLGPLNKLVNQWRTFNSFKQSADRLGQTFNTISERTEAEVELETPKGELRTENVVFSYGESAKPILNNVTVSLPAGGIHALRSGFSAADA